VSSLTRISPVSSSCRSPSRSSIGRIRVVVEGGGVGKSSCLSGFFAGRFATG
jgi:hypothetical protein